VSSSANGFPDTLALYKSTNSLVKFVDNTADAPQVSWVRQDYYCRSVAPACLLCVERPYCQDVMYDAVWPSNDSNGPAIGRKLGRFAAANCVEPLSTRARHSMSVCQTASAARPDCWPATQPSVDNRQ